MEANSQGRGRGGGPRKPRKAEDIGSFGGGHARKVRDESTAIRGAYRKRAPRLQNISSFGDSLASGEAIPEKKEAAEAAVTFESLKEKQRLQNEKLLSQLAAQLEGDDSEEEYEEYNTLSASSGSTGSSPPLRQSGEKPVVITETCQICLDRVRPEQAIWDCPTCFSHQFHLYCIKAWVNEALQRINLKELNTNTTINPRDRTWHCPNCRTQYSFVEAPQHYFCYCGKVKDPPANPWLEPHSCGEICGRLLACGQHTCTSVCHGGRCSPCAQQMNCSCFCGAAWQVRRCSERKFSCGKVCGKQLACKVHHCQLACHDGDCPPCGEQSMQKCRCGRVRQLQPCAEPTFSCGQICGKQLSCAGKHTCQEICHSGDTCPPCPRTLPRSCFCGKKSFQLSCTEDVGSCGGTCGKLLPCGIHRCTARCHAGECPKCMVFSLKSCRCGKSVKKELPCSQEYRCERKCENMRNCKRHRCHQRCCTGVNCPDCQKTCDKPLACGNHHCLAICHTGACDPCPRMMTISCLCGVVTEVIPCGKGRTLPHTIHKTCRGLHREGDVSCGPPRFLECDLPCGNVLNCGVHRCMTLCHIVNVRRAVVQDEASGLQYVQTVSVSETNPSENCQICAAVCNKPLQWCDHPCPEPCHLNACPTCRVVVELPCHCKLDKKRKIVCHDRLDEQKREMILSCGAKCTRQLKYCNHTCSGVCHSGECQHTKCPKKVSVKCSCKNRKETVTCEASQQLRIAMGLDPVLDRAELEVLPCDDSCLQRRAEKKAAREALRAKIRQEKIAAGLDVDEESSSEEEPVPAPVRKRKTTPVEEEPSSLPHSSSSSSEPASALWTSIFSLFSESGTANSSQSRAKSRETAAQRKKNAARRRMFSYFAMGAILLFVFALVLYLALTGRSK